MTYFSLTPIYVLILCLCLYSQDCSQSFISEVHANPKSRADSEAEFVEIYQFADTSCDYQMSIDGQDLLNRFSIKEQGFFYSTRQSDPKLLKSLPNSNSYTLILFHDSLKIDSLVIPMSQEGDSWERQFPLSLDVPWVNHSHQDKLEASPGYGAPLIQKQTLQCYWSSNQARCNSYEQIFLKTSTSQNLNDWTEVSHTPLLQSTIASPSNSPFEEFLLIGDEYPVDNVFFSMNTPLLEIINVNPVSNDSLPEWIHLKSFFEIDSLLILKEDSEYSVSNLPIGDCILTKDSLTLSQFLGPIRHCILEPERWPTLLNSRGELCIDLPQNSSQTHCFTWDQDYFYTQDSMTQNPLLLVPFDVSLKKLNTIEISSRIWDTSDPPEINLYSEKFNTQATIHVISINGNQISQTVDTRNDFRNQLNDILRNYTGQMLYLEISLGQTQSLFKLYVP